MSNWIIIVLLVIGLILWIGYAFRKRPEENDLEELGYEMEDLVQFSKNAVEDVLTSRYKGKDNLDYIRREERRKDLQKAIRHCMHGNISDKLFVKSFLRSALIKAYDFSELSINKIIPFNKEDKLTTIDKFDILLYVYTQKFGKNGFSELVKKYDLARLREIPFSQKEVMPDGSTKYRERGHIVLASDINDIYEKEEISLTLEEKIDIVVQRVYQHYKGLGVIDELRDQNIDGVRGGTSGLPPQLAGLMDIGDYLGEDHYIPNSYDAVWVFYKGVSLHLECLSFGSDLELRRICENIYTFSPVGQFNKRNGHKISEMADNSRVVVTGPNLTDSYAFFVRKFDGGLVDIASLFNKNDGGDMIIEWIDLCAKGGTTIAFTGQQGTGKTTLMRAAVSFFYGFWNIRVQEGSAFELWLRKAYPWKDILTFKETPSVSGEEGLYIQKKTDGTVNLVGEAAEDRVISWIMKTAKVASLFTWFTHHANTPKSLIDACRDALISCGFFSQEKLAEAYVSSVLKFNLHLKNVQGHRFMERFTEFLPVDVEEYPVHYRYEIEPMKMFLSFMDTVTEFFRRSTDRKVYTYKNIFEYKNGRYIMANRPADSTIQEMRDNMLPEDQERLDEFLDKYAPARIAS